MYSRRVCPEYHIRHADEQIPLLVYTPQPTPLENQSPYYGVTVDAIKVFYGNSIKYNLTV
jgi:hypothetical protein